MMTKQVARPEAYKLRIAAMVLDGGSNLTELAEKEKVPYNTMWTWVQKLKATRGEVPEPQPERSPTASITKDGDLRKMRLENKLLQREIEQLKAKVAAYKSALKFALEG